jgi:hypothetical protein
LCFAGKPIDREVDVELECVNKIFHSIRGMYKTEKEAYGKLCAHYKERSQTGFIYKCNLDVASEFLDRRYCGVIAERTELPTCKRRKVALSDSDDNRVSDPNVLLYKAGRFPAEYS